MKVIVETVLPCSADLAWAQLRTSRLLAEVCAPMVAFEAGLPECWEEGTTVRVRTRLFGLLPVGIHELLFERIDNAARQIQSRERDAIISKWDHLMTVTPVAPGSCRLRDEIEIEAGLLTLPVWLFAQALYRHRHRNWQKVARRLAAG